LGAAESQALRDRLAELDTHLASAEKSEAFAASVETLLDLAESWNRQRLGGALLPGRCLDADGSEHEGEFAVFGPAGYFAASDGTTNGLVVTRIGSPRPTLFAGLGPEATKGTRSLVAGEEAMMPLDLSGGDALKVAARKTSIEEHLVAGGVVMIPLLAVGLIAALLIILKTAGLVRIRAPREVALDEAVTHLKEGRVEEAQAGVASFCPPFRDVLTAALEHRDIRREHLEEILQERALASLPALERHLGLLAVLAGVAPLLGLLGTVTGMIHTFELVTLFGTGDAKLLSGGISEALVTTETGLVIAVPILLIHAMLSRRVRTTISALERTVVGFMNRLYPPEAKT
ncbi:MAG: MotA/TolQ/ExbB proton channel family protein, partial [Verrucomicrobiota bacterium]